MALRFTGLLHAAPPRLRQALSDHKVSEAHEVRYAIEDSSEIPDFVRQLLPGAGSDEFDEAVKYFEGLYQSAAEPALKRARQEGGRTATDMIVRLPDLREALAASGPACIRVAVGLTGVGYRAQPPPGRLARWPGRLRRSKPEPGDSQPRKHAEDKQRERWLSAAVEIVREARLPIVVLAE